MKRADLAGAVHSRLCDINGVSHKIASFFLRDLTSKFHLERWGRALEVCRSIRSSCGKHCSSVPCG